MSEPIDHTILDDIDDLMSSCCDDEDVHWKRWERQSECIEFQDEEGEWFEIVVRPIDGP